MAKKSINVGFRGDGSGKPEYEGRERRTRESRAAMESRVIEEIRDEVELAIAKHIVDKHKSGRGRTQLDIKYRSVSGKRPRVDPDTVREEVIDQVVADLGAQLAIDATSIRGIKPRKSGKR